MLSLSSCLRREKTYDNVVDVVGRPNVSIALDVAGEVVAVQAGVDAQAEAETLLRSSLSSVRLEIWMPEMFNFKLMFSAGQEDCQIF
jgi:hypothetical protein